MTTANNADTLTTLILSFISFMAEETSPANGVIHTSKEERIQFAAASVAWNIKHKYDVIVLGAGADSIFGNGGDPNYRNPVVAASSDTSVRSSG